MQFTVDENVLTASFNVCFDIFLFKSFDLISGLVESSKFSAI